MTEQEKLKAIRDRVPLLDETITKHHISYMLLVGYLQVLNKEGMVTEGEYKITPIGQNVIAICEEFDWKPSDNDIKDFVREMMAPEDYLVFIHFLTRFRDDRNELLKDIRKFKDTTEGYL